MMQEQKLTVDYDQDADVLYVALGEPVAASTDEDDEGLLVRYAYSDGHPCGVTVLGFRGNHWVDRAAALHRAIAEYLSLPPRSVAAALKRLEAAR